MGAKTTKALKRNLRENWASRLHTKFLLSTFEALCSSLLLIMEPFDLSMSFEEFVTFVSAQYRPGSEVGGAARNAVIEMWGAVVGRTRALRELDETIAKYGSLKKTATALSAGTTTLKRFRTFFENLPIEPDAGFTKYKMGDEVAGWRLRSKLGTGGNAIVWRATKSDTTIGAIKICIPDSYGKTTLARFSSEVEIMKRLSDLDGVMPIIESYVPFKFDKKDIPWLVMPVAESLPLKLKDANPKAILVAFAAIAATMEAVHAREVSHRDLKPENLFWLNERWCIGDFGIASFPDKKALTQDRKKLGPIFYIAPEMLNSAATADGKPADVYSLAKSLWRILTGLNIPLPGTLWKNEEVTRVTTYLPVPIAFGLEPLFEMCTLNDPNSRPTMSSFAKELNRILRKDSA